MLTFFRKLNPWHLTPTIMRQRLLEESEEQLVDAAKNREHWHSIEQMLLVRISRLQQELKVKQ